MERRGFSDITARLLVPVLILALALPPELAWAQTGGARRFAGQPIREVVYSGLVTLSEETLDHYLFGGPVAENQPVLDLADLDARVERLWSRELIDDIDIRAEEASGGVRLEVAIVERPLLVELEYKGLKRVSRTDINDQVDKERIDVYAGQPLRRGEMERLVAAIEDLYKEKGFRFAQVSYDLEEVTRGQTRAVFTIDEGDKVKISDIEFDGNTVYSDLRLRLTMRKTKESGLLSRITKKDIYNPASIDEDLEKLRELYRKAGYKDVILGRPEIEVVAERPDAPTIEEQRRRLEVTVPIEEGERWRLGEVQIEGNEVFSDEILLRQFETPRGGWLRSKPIEEGVENINKLYQSIGYIFADLETELREQPDQVADLIVRVDEKDQFRVGRIEFEGNEKTQDKVLRRELLVQEGAVMSMTGLQNSLLKIRQLNYFALDEEEPVEFDFDAEEKTVDLRLKGEEAERTELQFGGGWSELDGFFGQFALRTTNFLGRGETLGVSIQTGSRRNLYDLEYRVPWLLDRPQTLGIRVFNQSYENRLLQNIEFEQEFSGASLTYGRGFGAFQSANLVYSFNDVLDVQRFDLLDDDGEPIPPREVSFTSSSLRPIWSYNTLDSRYEPTRGRSFLGSVEYAGSFLGGDSDFVRPLITYTWFKPVSRNPFRSSFGLNVEAGYITSLNDDLKGRTTDDAGRIVIDGLFPLQRFFLGGDNSIRGFDRRGIFVRNEDGTIRLDQSGFPIGGTQMLQVNLEYHILSGGPFRFVLFGDIGGVFDDDQNVDIDLMRYTMGAELRIAVPLFPAPLRFIYAINPDELDGDRFESFDFSLSTSF